MSNEETNRSEELEYFRELLKGTPLYESTLTFDIPGHAPIQVPALWSAMGDINLVRDEDAMAKLTTAMASNLQRKDADTATVTMVASIALNEDPSICADVNLDENAGFFTECETLSAWVAAKATRS